MGIERWGAIRHDQKTVAPADQGLGGFQQRVVERPAPGEILWTNPDGRMEISTVDAAGQRVAAQTYASPGMQPRRIAAGADGRTRVLWSAPDGSGAIWLLHADNSLESQHHLEGAR